MTNNNNIEKEKLDVIPFPENTEYDLNIMNWTFDIGRLLQGLACGGVIGAILFILLQQTRLVWTYRFSLVAVGFAIGVMLGIKGINGDSIAGYIYNSIVFYRRKRTVYYNPRVKSEIKFFTHSDEKDNFVAPREKIEEMYRNYIAKNDKKSAEENLNDEDFNTESMYFEDDVPVLGKPEDFMTKKELRKYKKQLKKTQKTDDGTIQKGGVLSGVKKDKERKIAGLE